MKNIFVIVGILAFITAGSYTLIRFTNTTSPKPPPKIGFMGPLTGDASSYGYSILRGVELAKKELGMDSVEIIQEDSQCDPDKAKAAVTKLIGAGVIAIIGETCSEATLAAIPIAEEAKTVMISPSATSPELTGKSPYFFRTVPSDSLQGQFGAKLLASKGHKRIAIIYSNESYGKGFLDVLSRELTKQGATVILRVPVERNDINLKAILSPLAEARADAAYIISNSPSSAAAAIKEIRALDPAIALFGSEGLSGQVILDDAGKTAEGLIVTAVSGGTKQFRDSHKVEYGTVKIGPYAAQGYDAFTALAKAIHQGADTRISLRDHLAATDFQGASGTIRFDNNGDVDGNYDVLVVANGTFVHTTE